jgi:hypothetical protein
VGSFDYLAVLAFALDGFLAAIYLHGHVADFDGFRLLFFGEVGDVNRSQCLNGFWRDGRVAEGGGLLNHLRHFATTPQTCTTTA